jgi:hypothetical protein
MGKKGPKAKPMSALFKMSPKTAAFVEAMEKGTPKQKAMAKAVRAKNESKDDVTGNTLMKADYAAMMGGYKSPLTKKDKPKSGSEQRAGEITDADRAKYKEYQAAGGKLKITEAKRTNFRSPSVKSTKLEAAKAEKEAKAREDMAKAKRGGLGTVPFADRQKDIYK